MLKLRTRTRGLLVVGLIVGCYLYEGQDRPVWQRDISPLSPVVRNGHAWDWDNSWRLLFAGICDHEQNVALLDTSLEPPVLLQQASLAT